MRYTDMALDRMKAAIGGDDAVLAEIVASFVEEAETLAAGLREACAAAALPTAGRIAHTIKSSARDFGDEELAELCAGLEHEARAGKVNDLERRGAEIAMKCDALGRDLAAYIRDRLGGQS